MSTLDSVIATKIIIKSRLVVSSPVDKKFKLFGLGKLGHDLIQEDL
jgi:hypothetical protein